MKISRTSAGATGLALILAAGAWLPAIGQDRPVSLLPPGFDQTPTPAPRPTPSAPAPTQLLPPSVVNGSSGAPAPGATPGAVPSPVPSATPGPALPVDLSKYELPDFARRSLASVGPSTPASLGLAHDTLGKADGRYLEVLMRRLDAPVASRWMSIALRRMLVSRLDTPARVTGPDFAAERAWLLLRMGDSVAARYLVQSVDVDQYTPKMFQVAMQAALATGDPAGLCAMTERVPDEVQARGWQLAQAMCSGLGGKPSEATQRIDDARRAGVAGGIDLLLAEKVAGMGGNGQRAVTIEWGGVDKLSTWRFGLAAASGEAIPDSLFATVRPQAKVWKALLPGPDPANRAAYAELGAAYGIFSNAALVDLYGEIADANDNTAEAATARDLRNAYVSADPEDRAVALRALWSQPVGARAHYGRLVLTARAAATLPVQSSFDKDADNLVAAMLSAGLAPSATRWKSEVSRGSDAWAMLALGDPSNARVSYSDVVSYRGSADARKAQMLVAGLAGLGRLDADDARRLANDAHFDIDRQDPWTWAIDAAAARHQPATVVLLGAVGMQTPVWRGVPPQTLYHVCKALTAVGLENYARMIAAEAIARL